MRLLVTGGAGFIGSAVIRAVINETNWQVCNLDCLTYAGNLDSLRSISANPRYCFEQINIRDSKLVSELFFRFKPHKVMHLAAESHVDRSIDGPSAFLQTNIFGTYNLLEAARTYWKSLSHEEAKEFRFHHVSTDEVYGSLGSEGLFSETTPYQPNSPYSATKASSDHLVRAWFHTYGLPVVTSNCSNNYGPYQFPEKMIPLMILNALKGQSLPVYGRGDNIRDWLYVEDHVRALFMVLLEGKIGEVYNIGGRNERTNLEVVQTICDYLDQVQPIPNLQSRRQLITFVNDRPGHDHRYAIDASKLENELGWRARENFTTGIQKTIRWYIENDDSWCARVLDGTHRLERLGVST